MTEMESHTSISQRSLKNQVAVHGLSFGTSNRKKQQGPFHDAQSMITMKHTDQELNEVIRSSQRRMLLSRIGAFLAMFGLVMTFAISEVCSVGYEPTDEEILAGMLNPYEFGGPCAGSNAFKLWVLQATISMSTALLGLVVVLSNRVNLQLREQQIMFIARNSDPPDINTFNRRMRRARRQAMWWNTILELVIAVLPHPVPGLRHTFEIPALQRVAKYEFENVVVIFMFPRFYHVWKLVMYNLFYNKSVPTYWETTIRS